MSQLLTRFFTATIGASLLVGSAWLGAWYFGIAVMIIALLGQLELYQLYERSGVRAWIVTGLLVGAGLSLRALIPNIFLLTAVPVVGLVLWCTFTKSEQPLTRLGATLSGAVYPTALLAFLTDLRVVPGYSEQEALILTVTVLVLVWAVMYSPFLQDPFLVGMHWHRQSLLAKPGKDFLAGLEEHSWLWVYSI